MPVLDGFSGVRQHGHPVLPAGAFSIAAYTAHPNHLVMADTDGGGGREENKAALNKQTTRTKVNKGRSQILSYFEKFNIK